MRGLLLAIMTVLLAGCEPVAPIARTSPTGDYAWEQVTADAGFPGAYNFPVFVQGDRAYAMHPQGTWSTEDGETWRREPLPGFGFNSAYLKYVQHDGAVYALGSIEGNYLGYTIDPTVRRTRDFRTWETVGTSATLPRYIFYDVVSFRGALWLAGGMDMNGPKAEVWRSDDAVHWTKVVDKAPWSARSGGQLIVFKDRLWLIGGGVVDGPQAGDIWSSQDGIGWTQVTSQVAPEKPMGTAAVFDNRLFLIGANRSGTFSSAMLVSNDGVTWTPMQAPWTPRGGVATWEMDSTLYMTGGKYSRPKPGGAPGELEFIYSHDVWRMDKG